MHHEIFKEGLFGLVTYASRVSRGRHEGKSNLECSFKRHHNPLLSFSFCVWEVTIKESYTKISSFSSPLYRTTTLCQNNKATHLLVEVPAEVLEAVSEVVVEAMIVVLVGALAEVEA